MRIRKYLSMALVIAIGVCMLVLWSVYPLQALAQQSPPTKDGAAKPVPAPAPGKDVPTPQSPVTQPGPTPNPDPPAQDPDKEKQREYETQC